MSKNPILMLYAVPIKRGFKLNKLELRVKSESVILRRQQFLACMMFDKIRKYFFYQFWGTDPNQNIVVLYQGEN